jgi:cell fate (sporulation/competence/biofilm development) regulator YmcA (YheA/YmcA/DUF963 family)
LSKSGTVLLLIYGEVQAAEASADSIHKIKLLLKELWKTGISLPIIIEKPLVKAAKVTTSLQECNELIRIFTKDIETALLINS